MKKKVIYIVSEKDYEKSWRAKVTCLLGNLQKIFNVDISKFTLKDNDDDTNDEEPNHPEDARNE